MSCARSNAANRSKDVAVGKLSLDHVNAFAKELADAGIHSDIVSPKLLPDYRRNK